MSATITVETAQVERLGKRLAGWSQDLGQARAVLAGQVSDLPAGGAWRLPGWGALEGEATGTGLEVGGVALDATGVGAVIGIPTNVAAAGMIVSGAAVTLAAAGKAGEDLSDDAHAADTPQDSAEGIPGAENLSPAERATGVRLQEKLGSDLTDLRASSHVGAEYIGTYEGRIVTFDTMGDPDASPYLNQDGFFKSIQKHLLKSNTYIVIDLTGFSSNQIDAIRNYVDALPSGAHATIIRIGF